MDENLKLPAKGDLLYVAAGTGTHLLKLRDSAPDDLRFTAIESDEEKAAIAEAKIRALNLPVMLRTADATDLPFEDDSFDVVICEASILAPEILPQLINELRRVAAPKASLRLATVTSGSYGEIISLLWEALFRADSLNYEAYVEELTSRNITSHNLQILAEESGWRNVATETKSEIFSYQNAEEFFAAPLITHFVMPYLTAKFRHDAAATKKIAVELRKVFEENTDELDFQFSVKATILGGKK